MLKCSECGFESTIDEIDGTKGFVEEEICYDCWLKKPNWSIKSGEFKSNLIDIEPKDSPLEQIIKAIK